MKLDFFFHLSVAFFSSLKIFYLIFKYVHVCVEYVHVYMHMPVCACMYSVHVHECNAYRIHKRAPNPLGLNLQVDVSWVLGTELLSSVRAAKTLNC